MGSVVVPDRLINRILKQYTNYEDAYYAVERILSSSRKTCSRYFAGCMCRKCMRRDKIERKLLEHYYGAVLKVLFGR